MAYPLPTLVDLSQYWNNIKVENGAYRYDVMHKEWTLKDMVLNMGGLHNIENSIAAITVSKYLGIDDEKIRSAVANFKGVKRRFEYVIAPVSSPFGGGRGGAVMIDDYAHHPEELTDPLFC